MLQHRFLTACALAALQVLQSASAQQVESLAGTSDTPEFAEPIDMGQATTPATGAGVMSPAAGGRPAATGGARMVAGMSMPAPLADALQGGVAQRAAAKAALRRVGPAPLTGASSAPAERAVFAREPVRVNLTVDQERLITLPSDALLHVPADMESVARIESIGGTLYVTALKPFAPIRIVAELVDSGQQIPMDLVAENGAKVGQGVAASTNRRGELQLSVIEPSTVPAPTARAAGGSSTASSGDESPAADMVQLTRHAARQLYAPRRLAHGTPGVSQVAVSFDPVPGLLRGVSVDAAPVGQWKSGNLYVTAVRVTNKSRYPVELPLESIRGRWLAATAQHGRIGAAGSETDTTAVYLVCERSFESCL